MAIKFVIFAALVAFVRGGVIGAPVVAAPAVVARISDATIDPNPAYSFAYDVQDALTGDSKSQVESRANGIVKGQYTVADPDGTRRIVDYYADPIHGFNAVVRKTPLAVAAPIVARAAPVVAAPAPLAVAPAVARVAAPVVAAPAPYAYAPGIARVAAPYAAAPAIARAAPLVAAAPGALPYSVAPGALPYSVAPGALPYSVAPGALPYSAAPGALPYAAAPGLAPAAYAAGPVARVASPYTYAVL